MYTYLTALLAAFSLSTAAQAQPAELTEHQALALEMLELSGAVDMANTMMADLAPLLGPSFRQGYPDASDAQISKAVDIFIEAFRARNDQMNREVARSYEDLLSIEDLRAIVAFYRSPAGERLMAATPVAMERANAIGERLAQEIMAAEGGRIEAVLTGRASDE